MLEKLVRVSAVMEFMMRYWEDWWMNGDWWLLYLDSSSVNRQGTHCCS